MYVHCVHFSKISNTLVHDYRMLVFHSHFVFFCDLVKGVKYRLCRSFLENDLAAVE